MKKNKNSKTGKLVIDVLEYAFVEWLVRRKAYSAFQSNYDRSPSASKTFRERLREHIQYLLNHSNLGPESLISSAFLFTSAPEGYRFWQKLSDDWERFYNDL